MSSLTYARCPYCKTSNYAVEYRGGKTKEEKSIEQIVSHIIITVTFLYVRDEYLPDYAHFVFTTL